MCVDRGLVETPRGDPRGVTSLWLIRYSEDRGRARDPPRHDEPTHKPARVCLRLSSDEEKQRRNAKGSCSQWGCLGLWGGMWGPPAHRGDRKHCGDCFGLDGRSFQPQPHCDRALHVQNTGVVPAGIYRSRFFEAPRGWRQNTSPPRWDSLWKVLEAARGDCEGLCSPPRRARAGHAWTPVGTWAAGLRETLYCRERPSWQLALSRCLWQGVRTVASECRAGAEQ